MQADITEYFRTVGTKGGRKRMESLTDAERKELARKAGLASGQARRASKVQRKSRVKKVTHA